MKPLRDAIRELLDARDMSVKDLWASADLHPSDVYRYLNGERGRRMNSQAAETIEKLAGALGVEPDYFLEYRAWTVQEITREYPALADEVYELLVSHAAAERGRDSLRSKGT